MLKKSRRKIVGDIILLLFLMLFIGYENNYLKVSEYVIESEKLPKAADGYVIVHISDLHNKQFGKGNKYLLEVIRKQEPDMIVITGDLVDSNHPNIKVGVDFVSSAMEIAPVYYVTGNHDNWLSETDTYHLMQGLKGSCHVLENEMVTIGDENTGELFRVAGLDDAAQETETRVKNHLEELLGVGEKGEDNRFTLLLAHQPQYMPVYSDFTIDLVCSGHAHGGQFQLPFIGGFVAPGQGFLPKYSKGKYIEKDTVMILSGGLGNSVVPVRLLNRPEVVKITLRCK